MIEKIKLILPLLLPVSPPPPALRLVLVLPNFKMQLPSIPIVTGSQYCHLGETLSANGCKRVGDLLIYSFIEICTKLGLVGLKLMLYFT